MDTEQSWHNTKYIDKGNTCPQDTFYYCSDLYDPKMSFANKYTDYADCVVKKTEEDCGEPFAPENVYGGENPYKEAHAQEYSDKYGEEEDEVDVQPSSPSIKMTANMYLMIAIVLGGILILSPEKNKK
mgnify:CR=1 FL=1